ncbi:MAG: hypothetical protein GQ527_08605 [Bacteroidales bacterium]|nr:hypothetical protein [Bacteroidales bacterium]
MKLKSLDFPSKYGKKFAFLGLIILSSLLTNSCEKDEENTEEQEDHYTISGMWEFTLSPDNSRQDTSLIKGIRGSDEEEYPAVINEIYLYENSDGSIIGDHGLLSFQGHRTNNLVELKVFSRKNGDYHPNPELEEMDHISTMNLSIDEYGIMNGNGIYLENPDYDHATEDSYFIKAFKRSDINNYENDFKESQNHVLNTLCDITASIDSWLISTLSGNTFRPIGNCYLQKSGGGYYIFGHEGPGSLLPIYTQTVYYPFEWSWCKVRKYTFDMELKDEVRSIEALNWFVEHQPPAVGFYQKIGFETIDLLQEAIQDFNEKFGGFAISIAYNTRTKNLAIFANHKSGSSVEAKRHHLITTIGAAMIPHINKIYYHAGHHIIDHWYLRRSEFGVCNTPLLICYVIGTHNVAYE